MSYFLLIIPEPFLPLDLQAVFSAGVILILTTIAYPDVAIDNSCIAKADEILGWMQSKGNGPANYRRQELAELQEAARRINAINSQSSFNPTMPGHDNSWLWNALDIDGGALHQNLVASSMNLTCNDAWMVGMPEDMPGLQWL